MFKYVRFILVDMVDCIMRLRKEFLETKIMKVYTSMFDLDESQHQWVDALMSEMSIQEKLGQMVCDTFRHLPTGKQLEQYMSQYPIGHVFVASEIIDTTSDHATEVRHHADTLLNATNSNQNILLCGDLEHGAGGVARGLTRFPNPMALGALRDPELAYKKAKATAEESKSFGVRWVLAPVADLNTNLNNPVINHRAYGDHPDDVIPLLKSQIRGMQEHGVAGCAKHFPGDGTDDRNQHCVTTLNTLSLEEWRQQHGRVFKELIDDGVMSIMIGHIGFPAYEKADARGLYRPATMSHAIMTDLLRNELGFKGIIVTDALTMAGFCTYGTYEDRMIESFNAGVDVFLWPDTPRFYKVILEALQDGRASMDRLEDSARRVLEFKANLGLHKNGMPQPVAPESVIDNQNIAVEIAEKSITLLRNRHELVPIEQTPDQKILFLLSTHPPDWNGDQIQKIDPFVNVFKERGIDTTVVKFIHQEFIHIKKTLDDYTFVILVEHVTTANADGTIRGLGPIWQFMAHSHPRKIIVSFGTPYYLHDVASADTYINAYCDCSVTQEAAAKALIGEIPFLGTSPVDCAYEFHRGDGILTSR